MRPDDSQELRKERGAFFTPPAIADYLAQWAVDDDPDARVMDPTCGEAVFLQAAGRRLRSAGLSPSDLDSHLFGIDLHRTSLDSASAILEVGNPQERWDALKERVQAEDVRQFAVVQTDFLGLIWCLDQYRVHGVPPRGMGDSTKSPSARLDAAYRSKGNWLGTLVALLLENRTSSTLAPRSRVQGFSQTHQIDVAWPIRERPIVDPRVCVETKMTGGPAFGTTPARKGTADWTNRRKELKFAATDLKLYRRQAATQIDHWDVWRKQQPPQTYFVWAARIQPSEKISAMVAELRALTDTYLDGAGLFAYTTNAAGTAYEPVPMTQQMRVFQLDDVLHVIADRINLLSKLEGPVPPAQAPDTPMIDTSSLLQER